MRLIKLFILFDCVMYKLHYDVNAGKQVNVVYKGMEIEVEAGEGGEGGDIEIQTNKTVTLNSNGTYEINPTEDFDVMKKVTATVNVPTPTIEEYKSSYIGDNGIHYINPSSGYDAMESVQVNVDVPGPITEANKTVSITENGTVEVYPSNGKEVMEKVTAVVNVPSSGDVDIESNKTVTITQNGTVEITPSVDKDAMAKVTATVNVPTAANLQEEKYYVIEEGGNYNIYPDGGYNGMESVLVNVNVPLVQGTKEVNITSNGHRYVFPDGKYRGFRNVSLNVNVPPPLANCKWLTDVSDIVVDASHSGTYSSYGNSINYTAHFIYTSETTQQHKRIVVDNGTAYVPVLPYVYPLDELDLKNAVFSGGDQSQHPIKFCKVHGDAVISEALTIGSGSDEYAVYYLDGDFRLQADLTLNGCELWVYTERSFLNGFHILDGEHGGELHVEYDYGFDTFGGHSVIRDNP